MTTRASARPVKRVVADRFIAEIRDRTLTLRPLRTRVDGPQQIEVTWEAVYIRAIMARVDAAKRRKTR